MKLRIKWDERGLCSRECDLFYIHKDYSRESFHCIILGEANPHSGCLGPGVYTLEKVSVDKKDLSDIAKLLEKSKELEDEAANTK